MSRPSSMIPFLGVDKIIESELGELELGIRQCKLIIKRLREILQTSKPRAKTEGLMPLKTLHNGWIS